LAAFSLVILAAFHPAHGECLSPSTPAGATATTVYRCPELDPSAAKQPALGNAEKTTEVERGSADVPWFEPEPADKKVDAAKMPAAKIEPAKAPDAKSGVVKAPDAKIGTIKAPDEEIGTVKAPDEKIETAKAPEPEEITKVKKKATANKKLASKKRVKKIKVTRAKTKKVKVATKPAKVETAEETPKIESKPPDEKTIVWTKKDMSLGSRVKTWLGF
jgi:hypothetical protein